MTRTLLLIVAGLTVIAGSAASAPKDSYRPYPHPYPQIIQADDYETIQAIESFISELNKSGRSESVPCSTATDFVMRANYPEPKTAALFSTLNRLLEDLSKDQPCRAVGFDQFSTRAYATRSIVEFDFGSTIVVVDAYSNGPDNLERLYVLDAIERGESFFWGHIP